MSNYKQVLKILLIFHQFSVFALISIMFMFLQWYYDGSVFKKVTVKCSKVSNKGFKRQMDKFKVVITYFWLAFGQLNCIFF